MKFKVWCQDRGSTEDDARQIEAFDAEAAAEKWAEWDDHHSADYLIIGGTPATVCVRDGDKVRTFTVHGEPAPHYHARELTPERAR